MGHKLSRVVFMPHSILLEMKEVALNKGLLLQLMKATDLAERSGFPTISRLAAVRRYVRCHSFLLFLTKF